MSLKIIGGEFGGRLLKSVRGMGTRPLLGQVREALFNILGERIEDAYVWDLFAGSGASGIEALSRGAARALFCEKNGRAVDVLKQNLTAMGGEAAERSVVMRTDAWDPPVSDAEIAPDVIFLDPPYSMVAEDPVKSMARARLLLERTASGGCVVFHFESGVLDLDDFDRDLDVDLREWGSTAIAFLWRKGEAPEKVRKMGEERRGAAVDAEDEGDDGDDGGEE